MKKQMQGDNTERRVRAKESRDHGHTASEDLVSTGASKQRHHVEKKGHDKASHQERLGATHEGKRGPGTSGKPRPGDRTIDPKRTSRWE